MTIVHENLMWSILTKRFWQNFGSDGCAELEPDVQIKLPEIQTHNTETKHKRVKVQSFRQRTAGWCSNFQHKFLYDFSYELCT